MTILRKTSALLVCVVVLSTIAACAPRGENLVEGVTTPGVTVLRMLDEKKGWALRGSRVLRTTDGGRVWKDVGPVGDFGPYGAGAAFVDSEHAWLVAMSPGPHNGESAPLVLRTANGGSTWESSSDIPERAMGAQIAFTDLDHGWLMLRQGVAMMHEQVTILASDNGGTDWTTVATTPIEGEPDRLPFWGDKTGVSFSDQLSGFVTGYVPAPESPYLFATQDAGESWAERSIPLAVGHEEAEYMTYPPVFDRTGAGVLPVRISGDERALVFYSTTDSGKTWTPGDALPTGDGRAAWDVAKPGLVVAVAGRDLHISTDAGKTWMNVTSSIDFGEDSILSFVSERMGWVLVQGKLMVTRDGGKTWKRT